MFKHRIRDNYLQDWTSEIENSSNARTYRLVCRLSLETYLKCVKEIVFFCIKSFQNVGTHKLEVEAGRCHKPNKLPYNERKCQLCNT